MNSDAMPARALERPNEAASHDRGRQILDLLAYIVLMFCTGFAVAVALGSIVLLLSSPAMAAPEDRGGLLAHAADGRPLPLPLVDTDVRIQVSGPIAHVRVEQRFENPTDQWFEGIYLFPLPDDAAIDSMRMHVGERVIESEIQEREQAARSYQQAKAAGQRTALLEQQRPNMFTSRVANIGPGEHIRIELEYRQQLDYRSVDGIGRQQLRLPLVVGPRYMPAGVLATDDEARITAPVAAPSVAPDNPVTIVVNIDAGVAIDDIRSAHHPVHVLRLDEQRAQVVLADGSVPAERDFELEWRLASGDVPGVSLFSEDGADGRHYTLLSLMPPAAAEPSRALPRELVFVVDTSGSMAGDSIHQARKALELGLSRLSANDRFNLIAFNSEAHALFPAALRASAANLAFAIDWVRRLEAEGGTEMRAALELALDDRQSSDEHLRQIVFLTDGAVGNERALFELIHQRLGRSRLFTVGIGSAPNGFFMRKAARFGRGSYTYVGSIDQVQGRIGELFKRLESPLVSDIEVQWPPGMLADMWPTRIPDLYAGEPVVLAAATEALEGDVVIRARIGGQPWQQHVALGQASPGVGIGSLWARRRIEAAMDQLADGRDEASVRAEVVPLALEHRLATRYTSFVAIDRTPARAEGEAINSAQLPNRLPQGWDFGAVFGELPRGAAGSRWHLVLGLVAIALAALLALIGSRPRLAA